MTIQNHEGHILLFGSEHGSEALLEVFPDCRESFTSQSQKVWDILVGIEQREGAVSKESLIKALHPLKDCQSLLPSIVVGISTKDTVAPCIEAVREIHRQRTVEGVGKKLMSGDIRPDEAIRILENASTPKGRSKLEERRFSLVNPPLKAVPLLYLAGQGVSTAGNLTVITGQAKAGKSALLGGTFATLIDGKEHLGISASLNTTRKGWIHFDTEQSRYDHHRLVCRAMERASVENLPDWIRSYSLADVPTADRRTLLSSELASTKATCGSVGGVIIDGIADLCHDPNDPQEAFGLVEELHRLAIKFDCVVVAILHLNPGTVTNKTRGHLGSQLERKAESVIQLDKADDGIVTAWLHCSRNGYVPKGEGVRFKWDDDEGMFMQIDGTKREARAKAKDEAQRDELTRLAHLVVDHNGPRKWGAFVSDLVALGSLKKTAERKFTLMKQLSIVSQTLTGEWEIAA